MPRICPCGIALILIEPSSAARKWDLPVWKIWVASGCGSLYVGVIMSRERPSVSVAWGYWIDFRLFFARVD